MYKYKSIVTKLAPHDDNLRKFENSSRKDTYFACVSVIEKNMFYFKGYDCDYHFVLTCFMTSFYSEIDC